MITRVYNKIVFECDGCGDTLDTQETEFDKANFERRENRWSALRNMKGEWEHLCSRCSCSERED